jgi:hypothetical protein
MVGEHHMLGEDMHRATRHRSLPPSRRLAIPGRLIRTRAHPRCRRRFSVEFSFQARCFLRSGEAV